MIAAAVVPPLRPTRPLVAVGVATSLSVLWFVLAVFFDIPTILGWVPTVAGTAIAGYSCWSAVPATAHLVARRFWRQMGITLGLLAAAALTNALLVALRHDPVGTHQAPGSRVPPAALALYGTAILLLMWTLLRLPGRDRLTPEARQRFLLDAGIVIITAAVFVWYLSFRHVKQWDLIGGNAAPVMAIVLVAFIATFSLLKIALLGAQAVDIWSMRLLAMAAGLGASAGACAPLLASNPRLLPAILSLAPVNVLVVFSADRQRRTIALPPPPSRPRRLFSMVPYLAVAATDALLVVTAVRQHDRLTISVVAVGAVLLTAAVVYRQIHAITENTNLLTTVDATVQQLRETQHQLAHQAQHDALTGLANRRLFEERVQEADDAGQPASVVLIDLDDFKIINDRLGHATGDALLIAVARRLRSCVRSNDTVARLGGDEFALLLLGLSAYESADVLDRIAASLERPISIEGLDLLVSCSIGVADAEASSALDGVELLRRADLAMYSAKFAGKGRRAVYNPELDERAGTDAQLGADLRRALDHQEFFLLFQPVVRLPDGLATGAEALVRWQHPQRGLIPPDKFIAAAERTGLIVQLGSWIMREACRQAALWIERDGASQHWRVGINISARQLREPGIVADLAAAMQEAGLTPDRVLIEVTETAVFDNGPAVEALTRISQLGVRIALDDFGTGHSSLGLLRTTPVNVLKLDKSFVDDIPGSDEETIIAKAIVQIADGLHLGTVAEGVETWAQAERLHQLGYQHAQGYYFAKPMPAADMGLRLAEANGVLTAQPGASAAASELAS